MMMADDAINDVMMIDGCDMKCFHFGGFVTVCPPSAWRALWR
jgi:hypothetical protein